PWTAIGPANFIPHNTASDSSLNYISQWIRKCAQEHLNCDRKSLTPLPTRVIDVSTEPFLYITNGESVPYICLSYCWGKTTPFKTTRANLGERIKGIPFQNLPRTYRDAVTVTLRLGIQFLWIDALCIIQGDPLDWETESANMSRIYGGSYLTLAASSSSHADGGLF
ncbi:HET-domain-containing protein, partial [Glonium stellatum]